MVLHLTSTTGEFQVKTYRVTDGWGYQILVNSKVYIDQPFIPVLQGRIPFPDRKSARLTGKIVMQKLENHRLPAITREDIHRLGLDNLEKPN